MPMIFQSFHLNQKHQGKGRHRRRAGGLMMTFLLGMSIIFFFPAQAQKVYFTTGYKVMDITPGEATIWTRLCASEKPNPVVHERQIKVFRHPLHFDENMPVAGMDGGVAGTDGWVKITLSSGKKTYPSPWIRVQKEQDHTGFHHFKGLTPGTKYKVRIEGKASERGAVSTTEGFFSSSPKASLSEEFYMTTSTCQYFWSYDDSTIGFRTYGSMKKQEPDLFVQTGDYVYYDKPGPMATNAEKARHKWHAMDAWSSLRDFYKTTPVYMLKDDHDLLADDVHPGSKPFGDLTIGSGLRIWRENVPLRGKPYRTLQWGKDLQIWFLEGREYRSANDMPDGEGKSIWGTEQKEWLSRTIRESKATFKIVCSPTPVVGPDRPTKKDNHANKTFATEGDWARRFFAAEKAIVVNGDRHWQYVSRDAKTGLWEFGSGPVSDFHAQGWPPDERGPEHRFLRVAGGFLGIRLSYKDNGPILVFTHYDVDGKKTHEETITPNDL